MVKAADDRNVSGMNRRLFMAGVVGLTLCPFPSRAAEPKRSFRCRAKLDRVVDKKTIRQVEVVVQDGKSADVLDGSWRYDRMPRYPSGLYATFAVKDGAKIHLKGDFEYGQGGREAAGGSTIVMTDSKTSVEDDFEPAHPVAYPWTIGGEDYLLTVSVEVVVPK
jgi:hypothetical protein